VNRLLTDPRLRVGACAAVLVVAALMGFVFGPPDSSAGSSQEVDPSAGKAVVNRAALACPVLGSGGQVQTVVTAASPVLPDGTPTATGTATPLSLADLDPDSGKVYTSIRERGQMAANTRTARAQPLSVRAGGPLAAGAVATVTATATEGVNRGIASAQCVAPSSDFWFVGVSASEGRRGVLTLTNLDEQNASADVTLHGPDGVRDTADTVGIVVPARGQTEIYLNTVARGQRDLAVHVVATAGRVAATLRDNVATKTTPAGVDWVPAAGPPTTRVVVPAISPAKGLRFLTVVNPGDMQATATVWLHGPNGRFKPARKETLDIAAGATRVIRLDDALLGDGAAVSIDSDQPLTASVRMVDAKMTDFAAVGAAPPLTGPAYLALPAHPEELVLMLTAPDRTGSVLVEVRGATGAVLHRRELDIAEGATSVVPLKPQTKPSYLTVTPGKGGDLVAGVVLPPAKTNLAVNKFAAWTLTTSLVFRAQLGANPDVQAALR